MLCFTVVTLISRGRAHGRLHARDRRLSFFATFLPMEADSHPERWWTLFMLAAAELLGMSLWFAASAVAGPLGSRWALTAAQTGWLTTIVQLGFVAGTALTAMLNLADIIPSKRLFATAA